MKKIINFLVVLFPWKVRRFILIRFYHYQIHPTARIGLSYIYPKHLIMEEGAYIGHLNVAVHLDKMILRENVTIARNNWITGFPVAANSKHFAHDKERKSELIIGKESAITKNHHIDCTNSIHIGDYVTLAGYNSQLLTHSIDVYKSRQDSHPITIGDYCFVSTGVVILGGATLPSYSLLAAGAVLTKSFEKEWVIYAGVPAKPIKNIPTDARYFHREQGFVY